MLTLSGPPITNAFCWLILINFTKPINSRSFQWSLLMSARCGLFLANYLTVTGSYFSKCPLVKWLTNSFTADSRESRITDTVTAVIVHKLFDSVECSIKTERNTAFPTFSRTIQAWNSRDYGRGGLLPPRSCRDATGAANFYWKRSSYYCGIFETVSTRRVLIPGGRWPPPGRRSSQPGWRVAESGRRSVARLALPHGSGSLLSLSTDGNCSRDRIQGYPTRILDIREWQRSHEALGPLKSSFVYFKRNMKHKMFKKSVAA